MRHTLISVITVVTTILAPTISFANDKWLCQDGKISVVEFGNETTSDSQYCYNSDKTALISKDCAGGSCPAVQLKKIYSASELLSPSGKPGFKLCRELGGSPQIISFLASGKFYKLDRCVFKEGSFVDTDTLLQKASRR